MLTGYVRSEEAVRRLDTSRTQLRRYILRGELEALMMHGRYYVKEDDLERFIERSRVVPLGKV